MKAAITTLEISLNNLLTNEPIHRAAGNLDQADMEAANIVEIRQALRFLKSADAVKGLLHDAAHQLKVVNHHNDTLAAQMRIVDIFAAALKPNQAGLMMGEAESLGHVIGNLLQKLEAPVDGNR